MLEFGWDAVVGWLLEHGTRILIILVVGVVLWFALKKSLPPLVRRTLTRTMKGETKEGIKKRTDTLTSVFMGTGRVLIGVAVIFMILSDIHAACLSELLVGEASCWSSSVEALSSIITSSTAGLSLPETSLSDLYSKPLLSSERSS